ncbi:MAG: hypothetical protein ABI888_00130 [Chloroflexota bacterium]
MNRALAFAALLVFSACAPQTVARSSTPIVTIATATSLAPTTALPTAIPFPTSTATVWAQVCGRVTDFIKTTTTVDGSFVVNSPGRTPITVTLTVARNNPEGSFAGYACVALDAGRPHPIFAGLGAPNTATYIPEGIYPATSAMPTPVGFVIPEACAYVAPPLVGEQNDWMVDCGPELNRDARATLGAALTRQGWTGCGPALGTMRFVKGTLQLVVTESSFAPGEYPRLVQLNRLANGCGG